MIDEWIESECNAKERVKVSVSVKLDALPTSMASVSLILLLPTRHVCTMTRLVPSLTGC
jgi:hypothetical protein